MSAMRIPVCSIEVNIHEYECYSQAHGRSTLLHAVSRTDHCNQQVNDPDQQLEQSRPEMERWPKRFTRQPHILENDQIDGGDCKFDQQAAGGARACMSVAGEDGKKQAFRGLALKCSNWRCE